MSINISRFRKPRPTKSNDSKLDTEIKTTSHWHKIISLFNEGNTVKKKYIQH